MGEVVWLEERRGAPGRRGTQSRSGTADVGLERLERAVARLYSLVGGAKKGSQGADLERELVALCGAVSLDRFEEAADGAERLAARLAATAGTGG